MKKYISPFLMLVLATWVMAPGWAQAGSGFYLSGDLGANFSKGVSFEGASNDTYSECDQYLNEDFMIDGACPGDRGDIPNSFIPDWDSAFDGGQGILAGAAVGYSFAGQNPNSPLAGFRVELEYFYRESKHDQSASPGNGLTCRPPSGTCNKIDAGEFDTGPHERLGSITSHNLFANVFYDFNNTSRFTPYIGIGGGIGVTDADWSSHWARSANIDRLTSGLNELAMDPSRADDRMIFEHLAGDTAYLDNLRNATSIAQTTLSDTLWGLQILFGVDYAVTEAMSLGLKGRWVKFSSFSDGLFWNPLRGHAPYVRFDGTRDNPTGPMIQGRMSTSDIEFFGISVNMKYHF